MPIFEFLRASSSDHLVCRINERRDLDQIHGYVWQTSAHLPSNVIDAEMDVPRFFSELQLEWCCCLPRLLGRGQPGRPAEDEMLTQHPAPPGSGIPRAIWSVHS